MQKPHHFNLMNSKRGKTKCWRIYISTAKFITFGTAETLLTPVWGVAAKRISIFVITRYFSCNCLHRRRLEDTPAVHSLRSGKHLLPWKNPIHLEGFCRGFFFPFPFVFPFLFFPVPPWRRCDLPRISPSPWTDFVIDPPAGWGSRGRRWGLAQRDSRGWGPKEEGALEIRTSNCEPESKESKSKNNHKGRKRAGVCKDSPTNSHLWRKQTAAPEIRWRMIIIKQMSKPPWADVSSLNDGPRARRCAMRKRWIRPCSLIKWRLDGVRGREDKQWARRPRTQKYCQTLQTNAAICARSLCQNKLQTDRRGWITAVCLTMNDKEKNTHVHTQKNGKVTSSAIC